MTLARFGGQLWHDARFVWPIVVQPPRFVCKFVLGDETKLLRIVLGRSTMSHIVFENQKIQGPGGVRFSCNFETLKP